MSQPINYLSLVMEQTLKFTPQPYATMIAKGLLNAVRTSLHLEKAQRIFIYAGEPVTNPAMPIEWTQEVINHQLFGNLAETKDLPTNELVGFVDVVCPADPMSNVWTLDKKPAYLVGNAHAFDSPLVILDNKNGKVHGIEDYVPSHVFKPAHPYLLDYDEELVLPVNRRLFYMASMRQTLKFELTGSLAVQVLDDNGELKPFSKFTVINNRRAKSFLFEGELCYELTPDSTDLQLYPSVTSANGQKEHVQLVLSCRYALDD